MLRKLACSNFSQLSKGLLKANFAKKPLTVALTGAAGQIGYGTIFRIASGEMLGRDQPVNLNLVDLPFAEQALTGVKAELDDCSLPLLRNIKTTSSLKDGFKDVDVALLVGAAPRGPGMERSDLLQANGKIFIDQGKALNDFASRTVRVVVVGNPANTNCMIANSYAKDLPFGSFTALTRLDQNRALAQVLQQLGGSLSDIQQLAIWGNHSPTMYPDLSNSTWQGKSVHKLTKKDWRENEFTPRVQQRGGEIIELRGLSSAASAGNAAMNHIRDWMYGTDGQWTSMAVMSKGEYGVPEGLCFSYPVTCDDGWWNIVKGLSFTESGQQKMQTTIDELVSEREMVSDLMGN